MVDNHRRPFEPIENEFSKLNAACTRADEVVARGRRNERGRGIRARARYCVGQITINRINLPVINC